MVLTENPITRFEWILFDLDNTLLDFNASSAIAFHKSFEEIGIITDPTFYADFLDLNKKAWEAYYQNQMTHEEIKVFRFGKLFQQKGINHIDPLEFNALYFDQLVKNPVFIPGAVDVLELLRGKVKLGVVTNGMKEVQRPRLIHTGLLFILDLVVISGEIGYAKPSVEFFNHVFTAMGKSTNKEKVLLIGDHPEIDVRGAMNFGFSAAWFNPEGNKIENGLKPHFEWKSLKEIVHLFQG